MSSSGMKYRTLGRFSSTLLARRAIVRAPIPTPSPSPDHNSVLLKKPLPLPSLLQSFVARRSLSLDANPTHGIPDTNVGQSSKEDPSKEEEKHSEQEPVDEKTQVLEAALTYVSKLGWSEAALVAGARDVGLSPSIIGAIRGKESALVEARDRSAFLTLRNDIGRNEHLRNARFRKYFMDESLRKLQCEIEDREEELANLVLRDRLAKLVRFRLELQSPYISRWAQALSIQARPVNLSTTLKQRALLMDEIWHATGDRSSNVEWYTKRALLGGIYSTSELYMLTDHSPEFCDTWTFLERRIRDAVDCQKTTQEASQLAEAVVGGLGNSIQSFFRRSQA